MLHIIHNYLSKVNIQGYWQRNQEYPTKIRRRNLLSFIEKTQINQSIQLKLCRDHRMNQF